MTDALSNASRYARDPRLGRLTGLAAERESLYLVGCAKLDAAEHEDEAHGDGDGAAVDAIIPTLAALSQRIEQLDADGIAMCESLEGEGFPVVILQQAISRGIAAAHERN